MSTLTTARQLMERRAALSKEAQAILDKAAAEGRALAGEEEQTFQRIGADMETLRQSSERIVKFAEDDKAAEEALRNFPDRDPEPPSETEQLLTNLRSFMRGEKRELELAPKNHSEVHRIQNEAQARALSKGTAAAGGNTVPTTFYGRLYEHLILTASLLRGGATIMNTTSGENIQIPVTTAHGGATLVPEAGTIPQNDPAFGTRTIGAYKYGVLIRVPRELIDDTAVDLLGYLARQAGRAVGNVFGADLITGNGTGKPLGLAASTTLGITGGTGVAGVPTFDNLIDLFYSVSAPYRNSPDAAWLINDVTAGQIRKLKDTSGRYLWEPSLLPGAPDTVLGKPILTDPNVATTGVNANSVVFGDLSTYWVRLVGGIRFERSDEFAFDSDVSVFRCLVRGDGLLVDQTGAVKHYRGAAT
jgi:HK97 family phage major capsid protein